MLSLLWDSQWRYLSLNTHVKYIPPLTSHPLLTDYDTERVKIHIKRDHLPKLDSTVASEKLSGVFRSVLPRITKSLILDNYGIVLLYILL